MTAYLFDVDGVLTDPVEKRVIENELFTVLLSLLKRGDLVAINTGRSSEWVSERVIMPLLETSDDKQFFKDLITIAEKGGTWITYDAMGNPHHSKDQEMVVPHELNEQIKQLVAAGYTDSMFFDATKETMISVEMHDGFAIPVFHERQKEFVKEVEELIAHAGFAEKYKIDPSNISTDIEEKHAGKALGIDRLLSIFSERGITPSQYITFGDSASDFAMSDELEKRGKEVRFVYTGDKEKLGEISKPYPIVFAAGYSRGTLEYLKQHS